MCSYAESRAHWAEHDFYVPCLEDSFSVVKVLLEAPAKLHLHDGVGIDASVSRLVQSLALWAFEFDVIESECHWGAISGCEGHCFV